MGQPSVMLKTKTAVPAYRFDSVKRSHLLEQMNNGLQCRLTFVNAPAGYGKTTLLCQWAHDFSGQLAWLSLDEKDNDLVRFWRYIVHMLTNASSPHLAKNMENSMKAASHTSIFSFIDSLLNELATTSHQPLAIILDDYHVISESAIHDSLAYFIEYLPGNCHVYIASRSALPFSTAKWRLRSELVHLTPQQLLFDQAEAFSFCQQVHGLLLSEEQIASLVASTEGWVAGLQLAAISLSTSGNHEFFAKFTGAHRDISDYSRKREGLSRKRWRLSRGGRSCTGSVRCALFRRTSHSGKGMWPGPRQSLPSCPAPLFTSPVFIKSWSSWPMSGCCSPNSKRQMRSRFLPL